MTHQKRRSDAHVVLLVCLAVFVTGCSQSPYDLAPVSGKVTIDGQPLIKGRVVFAPRGGSKAENPGKPAFGVIQSDGSYALATYGDDDGAIVGEHSVTVFDTSDTPKFARLRLQKAYAVSPGAENHIDIQVTSQEVARLAQRGGSD